MGARATRTVTAIVLAIAAGQGFPAGGGSVAPTRDALEAGRRRAAALESELALASTRKPYLILDLGSRTLQYRLLGMTLREVPLPGMRVKGLLPARPGKPPEAMSLAGIFTVREKDNDPRLKPLTPEQVESGADDENVANVLPPEPPKSYSIKFKQPVVMRVTGQESQGAAWHGAATLRAIWDWLRGAGRADAARLEFSVRVDAKIGDEVYRSLIPDLRWLVLPPRGFILPPAEQEPPPKPKAPRAAPKPPPKPLEPPGVPFQIPSPVEDIDSRAKAPAPAQESGPPPEAPPPSETEEPPPADPEPAPENPEPGPPGGGRQPGRDQGGAAPSGA